jgi:N-acetyl-gamma-glutamyl-phosphate reductase
MLKTIIIGASGYTGAELTRFVQQHPHFSLSGLYVSAQSQDKHKRISDLHGSLRGVVDLPLLPLLDINVIADQVDVVFLATAHEVSHDLVPQFLERGCQVFDLSGAYRVNQADFYPEYYGFDHQFPTYLDSAVYGLVEWQEEQIQTANLVAVPGCYPTAIQLALKPLIDGQLIDVCVLPVISAISGATGAGRKAALNSALCEVSLQAYGVFSHRHQPEIATHLGQDIIFTPHLGAFKRGILANITVKLAKGVTDAEVQSVFFSAYENKPAVRLLGNTMPKLDDVVKTPFCDIGWKTQGQYIVLSSVIDNLLKGAASQAIQCANIRNGYPSLLALI